MVLSDVDIKKSLKNGEIVIKPFRKKLLKGASYTLRLNNVLFKASNSLSIIDSRSPQIKFKEISLTKSGYILEPNEFILAQTYESISISQGLVGFLDARTSLTRIGLITLHSSTLIEPGQSESKETLEIKNISQYPIQLFPFMDIVKCYFVLLSSFAQEAYSVYGKYRKQKDVNLKN